MKKQSMLVNVLFVLLGILLGIGISTVQAQDTPLSPDGGGNCIWKLVCLADEGQGGESLDEFNPEAQIQPTATPFLPVLATPTVVVVVDEVDECVGNPGNDKCVGQAGEEPSGKPGWDNPPGTTGQSDGDKDKEPKEKKDK